MPALKRYVQNNWVKAAFLLLLIVLLWQLENFPDLVERYYSSTLYKGISGILHLLFSWLPFSFGDVVYILIILSLLTAAFKLFSLIIKGEFKALLSLILKLVIGAETAIIIFYLFWGINYSRPPAAQLLSLTDTSYSIKDVAKVTRMIIDSANTARANIGIADLTQSDDAIHTTAVNAVKDLAPLSDRYKIFMPAVKSSLLSPLLNYMGTSGYYNPFTGEAQINKLMPVFNRPFTACHEMSHQMGFAREDEANFAGYIAGVNSADRLLKYSAYYEATIEFMRYLHRRDTTAHHQLKALLSKGLREDLKADSLYWAKYDGPLGMMSSRFYDSFLKANQQPAGLRTYNRMIILTMAWYKKRKVY